MLLALNQTTIRETTELEDCVIDKHNFVFLRLSCIYASVVDEYISTEVRIWFASVVDSNL